MDNPRSIFDGEPCPTCRARLRVTEVDPTAFLDESGRSFVISKYECEGEGRHRWGEMIDPLPGTGRPMKAGLVPEIWREEE